MMMLGCSEPPDNWPSLKFDERTWKATPESDRYKYVRDLQERRVLIGKSELEVIALLGMPNSKDDIDPMFSYLVKVGGMSFNKVFVLSVYFSGPGGKVDRTSVRGD
jgi:hypothetical protein